MRFRLSWNSRTHTPRFALQPRNARVFSPQNGGRKLARPSGGVVANGSRNLSTMNPLKIWQGRPNPLGATVTRDGVNFALFSENATGVDLCLFDDSTAPAETVRVRMLECTNHVWHCFLPGLKAGQFYGYRVHGPYDPLQGHRFNPAKLLLDPYAKALTGLVNWSSEM